VNQLLLIVFKWSQVWWIRIYIQWNKKYGAFYPVLNVRYVWRTDGPITAIRNVDALVGC